MFISERYLNGKITVRSLAAPTEQDIAAIQSLLPEDRKALLEEALEHGAKSGISDLSMDEIFEQALKQHQDRVADLS